MSSFSLVTQATYKTIEYALYKGTSLIEQNELIKTQACSLLMQQLNDLLHKHSLSWPDISYIGVNQGPAPFTTLRALITTINGISFATGIPLRGVDGLRAFAQEQKTESITAVLLNAFAGDVYYALQEGDTITTGWGDGKEYLESLAKKYPHQRVTFVGNAVPLLQETITHFFDNRALIKEPLPEYVSLQTIAQISADTKKEASHVTPLYLKIQEYK